jgi:hypothetical protein
MHTNYTFLLKLKSNPVFWFLMGVLFSFFGWAAANNFGDSRPLKDNLKIDISSYKDSEFVKIQKSLIKTSSFSAIIGMVVNLILILFIKDKIISFLAVPSYIISSLIILISITLIAIFSFSKIKNVLLKIYAFHKRTKM